MILITLNHGLFRFARKVDFSTFSITVENVTSNVLTSNKQKLFVIRVRVIRLAIFGDFQFDSSTSSNIHVSNLLKID